MAWEDYLEKLMKDEGMFDTLVMAFREAITVRISEYTNKRLPLHVICTRFFHYQVKQIFLNEG